MKKASLTSLVGPPSSYFGRPSDLNLASLGTPQCSRGPNAFGKKTLVTPDGAILTEWNHCLPYHKYRKGCILPRLYPRCFPPHSGIQLRPNHWLPLPPVLQYVIEPDRAGGVTRSNILSRLHSKHRGYPADTSPDFSRFFLDQRASKTFRIPACRDNYVKLFKQATPHPKCPDWKKAFRN